MSLSPEILERRRKGIAASDAAPIMGLSPYASPADVWIQKKHPDMIGDKNSKYMYWGSKHEATIADEYALQTGQKIVLGGFQHNAKHPWIMCQPDRLIVGKDKGLECKTANPFETSEWGPTESDKVPTHHYFQCLHSMIVMNYREWDLAALIGASDFRIYHLFWDNDLALELWNTEREFYERYIKGSETPEFDWGSDLANYVKKKFKKGDPKEESFDVDANGDNEIKGAIEALLVARNTQAEAEKEEKKQKTLIQAYMRNKTVLKWAEKNLKITWSNQKDGVKIDYKQINEKLLPTSTLEADDKSALIKEYTEIKTGVRRFVVYDGNKPKDEE